MMKAVKINLLRLGSVVPNGAGGPEAGAINLTYSLLLQGFGIDFYNHIAINQVGDDLDEIVQMSGKSVYINIRYPAPPDFSILSESAQNVIRLNIIHGALMRLSEDGGKIDLETLDHIKARILAHNFNLELVYRVFVNKADERQVCKIIVVPGKSSFLFFASMHVRSEAKCVVPLFTGLPTPVYFDQFFSRCKWKADGTVLIHGSSKESAFLIDSKNCKVNLLNLSNYDAPPSLEMMRGHVDDARKRATYKDWLHSLPPSLAALLGSDN